MKPIAWEAEDGAVFWSEIECKEYEERRRKKRNLKSRFYREDGLGIFPEVEEDEDIYRQCWYVYIADEEEVGFVNHLLDTADFMMRGTYIYDDDMEDSGYQRTLRANS